MVIPLIFVSNVLFVADPIDTTINFCRKIATGIGCANGSACSTCRPGACDQRHMSGGAVAQVIERAVCPFKAMGCHMIPIYLKNFLGVLPGQVGYIHVFPTPGGDIWWIGGDGVDCYVFLEKWGSYEFNYPKN